MSGPFGDRSPAEYQKLVDRLMEFRTAYVPYIDGTREAVYRGESVVRSPERTHLLHLAVLAEEAVKVVDLNEIGVLPPAASGGHPPVFGLANVAFAHENPVYRSGRDLLSGVSRPEPFDLVVDTVDRTAAILGERSREEEARRRRLSYWMDRGLRSILGFPAYVVSLLLGFDRRDLSKGTGRALWILAIVADVAGIAGAGVAFGWWG